MKETAKKLEFDDVGKGTVLREDVEEVKHAINTSKKDTATKVKQERPDSRQA